MSETKLPSGAILKITLAPFADAKASVEFLRQVLAELVAEGF